VPCTVRIGAELSPHLSMSVA